MNITETINEMFVRSYVFAGHFIYSLIYNVFKLKEWFFLI